MPKMWLKPRRAARPAAFIDRLALDELRIAAMADGIDVVRGITDPIGVISETWTPSKWHDHRARQCAARCHRG